MAEVVGLALGVIGLAGVIGAFKDVVDLCAIVIDTRGLGRDFEVLSTKFDIERTLLLQWAHRVNLLHPTLYDHRLNDVNTQTSVLKALSCIRLEIGDGATLHQRYGLQESTDLSIDLPTATSSGSPFMDKFVKEFEAFNIRSGNRSRSTKWSSKVRWAVRDKQRFEDLVAMMAHFTTKLNQLLPETQHMPPWSPIGRVEAQKVGLNGLKVILDASGGHDAIGQSARECIKMLKCDYRDRILDLLWFRRMDDRERSVATEYNKTFEWALESSRTGSQHPWDNLADWLQRGSGIYWISGKAGSGKSTLIKYLYHHQRTRALLANWAFGPCTLVRFYFWNLGTSEQKTQEGLSRSLLHQLLSENKALIEQALPDMWKDLTISHGETANLPSPSETEHAFKVIAESLPRMGKMCFFIDGLDEFVGDYMDGIRFIKRLATSPNVKIVVSSRPIPDCVAAFENAPKMHLHHLTRGDITSYVHGTLGSHEYMNILISRHPGEGVTILEEVIDKAAGVFLWVILACRSLLYGFAAYDRLEELRRRVRELPPELESMFQHMLRKVEPRHREQGARLLRLCYAKRRGCGSDNFDTGDMSAAGLAVLDEDPGVASLQPLGRAELRQVCDILIGRLRSRCGGLLELTPLRDIKGSSLPNCFCGGRSVDLSGTIHDAVVDGRVDFMHRTVYEFLNQENTWKLPCLQFEAGPGSDDSTRLSLLNLTLVKISLSVDEQMLTMYEDQAMHCLLDGLRWGAKSDQEYPLDTQNIFWHLQAFFDQFRDLAELQVYVFSQLLNLHEHSHSPASSHASLILALEAGAVNYAKAHPEYMRLAGPAPRSCGCAPALYYAIKKPHHAAQVTAKGLGGHGTSRRGMILSKEMAALLLGSGGNPNGGLGNWSPWKTWLIGIERQSREVGGLERFADVVDIAMMFLDAGALNASPLVRPLRQLVAGELQRGGMSSVEDQRKGRLLLERLEQRPRIPKPKTSPDSPRVTEVYYPRARVYAKEKRKDTGDGLMPSSSDQKAKRLKRNPAEGATRELPMLIDEDD
ncbi:prion-inhibition and propagation-domain-containing protein [Cercophora scortea]|uniref:Prion-inhibition and propagation-domain-containing protein n=1 Tax=Cercophora scortea TaxID=314031 RepID=A0AAE0M6I3_9PEZI|nr:prion-inhibition and propagation-domain-containing protein [Cercophora scortea]